MNKIIKGLLLGSLSVIIWLTIFWINKGYYIGMAILPAILISIAIFIIGFVVGIFLDKISFKKFVGEGK